MTFYEEQQERLVDKSKLGFAFDPNWAAKLGFRRDLFKQVQESVKQDPYKLFPVDSTIFRIIRYSDLNKIPSAGPTAIELLKSKGIQQVKDLVAKYKEIEEDYDFPFGVLCWWLKYQVGIKQFFKIAVYTHLVSIMVEE
jgi:hypothetical protein